jgi:hypothetical protein
MVPSSLMAKDQVEIETKAKKLIHDLEEDKSQQPSSMNASLRLALIIVGIILAGVATGFGVARATSGTAIGSQELKSSDEVAQTGVKKGDVVGVQDETTFRDDTEGVLVVGGADGEGSHHLMREGGVSQNVYLTSSIVDLELFVGHKVKVWGETFAAQKAGWLMDVGRVEVLELDAEPPFEE